MDQRDEICLCVHSKLSYALTIDDNCTDNCDPLCNWLQRTASEGTRGGVRASRLNETTSAACLDGQPNDTDATARPRTGRNELGLESRTTLGITNNSELERP